jgi:ubiquinone/menaquinone biosynthesis C-methylase UbiE
MNSGNSETEKRLAVEAAESRGRLTALREALYGDATRQMLEAARLQPGDHVLDVAAGTGDQSRYAARLVSPEGSVLATDISQEGLDVAARFARQEGLGNITTRVMNAEQLDLPEDQYDAVISRFGLMLIPNRHQALTEIRRVLKTGGRLAAIVWSTPERNPLFRLSDTFEAQLSGNKAQAAQQPDPFSLGDAGLFASVLTQAGFQDVQVQALSLPFRFPTLEVLISWWGFWFERALAALEPEPRQRIIEDIRQAVRPFEGPQGIEAPAEVLLGVGRK